MEKLTEKEREDIVLAYKLDNSKKNIQKICDDYGITKQYIFKLAKQDKYRELSINNNASQFTKRANEMIELAFQRLEQRLKDEDDKATLSQLSTLIGILYDKSRLESNLSTENKSISINIKVEH